MTTGQTIGAQWLPSSVDVPPGSALPAPAPSPAAAAVASVRPVGGASSPEGTVVLPLGISLAQAEQTLILATLAHYGRQKERTAAALGISLKTLYNRLKQYAADDRFDEHRP